MVKYLRFSLIIALLSFFAISCNENSTDPQYNTFAGLVLTSEGKPVAGAFIRALDSENQIMDTDSSDASGLFMLERIPDYLSDFDIVVSHPKYNTFTSLMSKVKTEKDNKLYIVLNKNQEQDSCCGKVKVIAFDGESEKRLGGVGVHLKKADKVVYKNITNDNGVAWFENICPGDYWIRMAKEGYEVYEEEFSIAECDTVVIDNRMQNKNGEECCNGSLIIRIKDYDSGQNLNSVKVGLWKDGEKIGEKHSEKGYVKFEDLCKGKYGIGLSKDGYKSKEFHIELECNEEKDITKKMMADEDCCNGKIIVYAKDDKTHDPLHYATVKLWQEGKIVRKGNTDKNGRLVFEEICEGAYVVTIEHDEYTATEFEISIECDEVKEIVKELTAKSGGDCCDGSIALQIKDIETRENIDDVKVRLWMNGKKIAEKYTTNGYVKFEELCDAKYGIDLIREGYETKEFHVELECNEHKEITKVMERASGGDCCNGKIIVYAKDDETHDPLHYATVKLWQEGKIVCKGNTDKNGRLVFEEICEGAYVVTIEHDEYTATEFEISIECDEVKKVVKKLAAKSDDECCTAVLKLIVKDADTEYPIEGAIVNVYAHESDEIIAHGKTNGNGVYVREELCAPRKYDVEVSLDGYQSQTYTFYFNECKLIQEHYWLVKK